MNWLWLFIRWWPTIAAIGMQMYDMLIEAGITPETGVLAALVAIANWMRAPKDKSRQWPHRLGYDLDADKQ